MGVRLVTGLSKCTRRRFLELGFSLAALAVFGCGMSSAASGSGNGDSNSGSSSSGGTSGSSGSGSGSSGSSGSGSDSSGSSGSGSGSGSNSGPGGGDDDGGEKKGRRSNARVERYLDTLRSRGRVVWANVRDDSIEIRYSDGWSEQVTSRRYRLRDPAKRVVIERAAKTLDFERLRSAAR